MDKDPFSQRIRIPITGLKSTFSRSMAKLKIIMNKRHGGMEAWQISIFHQTFIPIKDSKDRAQLTAEITFIDAKFI